MMKQYIFNLLISIDQLANTIIGGDPDETISSSCGKRVTTCKTCKWLCILLNKIDKRHCKDAIEEDEGKDEVIK
ncbi:MAG: hypothetical protein R8M45_05725 [Ghiorsea sp.]